MTSKIPSRPLLIDQLLKLRAGAGLVGKGRGLRADGWDPLLLLLLLAGADLGTCENFASERRLQFARSVCFLACLPRPMVHSQLPIPAPLCLLCAFLMLPSGMPATIPGGLSPKPVSDPEVQEAAAFAVEEYNALSANCGRPVPGSFRMAILSDNGVGENQL
ncbi:uncharacterized protein LOC117659335 isoform X1 [Pantherophis guttatus]|uniref:Uncharacterized protein LOC117659335 isoform X1 n=1 Tax=Pantherophis guttatus TaxID=94885 RepID=A0ABM3YQW3_PANGU|nr:uncharacterized protein LOC117659335 isoform X1 [Pantherophis guttatus]